MDSGFTYDWIEDIQKPFEEWLKNATPEQKAIWENTVVVEELSAEEILVIKDL